MFFRQRLIGRLEKLENSIGNDTNGVLFIVMNPDGTFGEERLTESELEDYVIRNRYELVIADDISKTDD
ncbi:hypothetical protein M2139_000313 [Enterococcus sp. PF1-24]|uniref:hypothetical protein n=1 Tax=unclassified Enterococcus TaxID=2608891 RepID=UPI0024769E70|nr:MULTISPECIES: hypothetical protein [unclassified Enterococcus]MDH6363267.1 hypothetical protein [Enterococcus sp. PFB1-1]MDH6400432.1 hypothetical protein [Enterococcus sp. PF1-24]